MLVKINDNSQKFLKEIDILKSWAGVGTASKAANFAVMNCDKYHQLYIQEVEHTKQLEAELYQIKSLFKQRDSINNQLNSFY